MNTGKLTAAIHKDRTLMTALLTVQMLSRAVMDTKNEVQPKYHNKMTGETTVAAFMVI